MTTEQVFLCPRCNKATDVLGCTCSNCQEEVLRAKVAKDVPADIETLIEAFIDRNCLADAIATLADIAQSKAEHLRSNWQDEMSARVWERAAEALNRTANKVDC